MTSEGYSEPSPVHTDLIVHYVAGVGTAVLTFGLAGLLARPMPPVEALVLGASILLAVAIHLWRESA